MERKKPLKPIYIGNVLYYVNFSSLIERKIDNFHIVCKCLVNLTSRSGKKATKFFVRLFANYYWCYFSMKLKIRIRKYNLCDLWLLTLIAVPKQRSHTHTQKAHRFRCFVSCLFTNWYWWFIMRTEYEPSQSSMHCNIDLMIRTASISNEMERNLIAPPINNILLIIECVRFSFVIVSNSHL